MSNIRLLLVFIVATLGLGLLIGSLTAPGEWYASLQKPFFNPPNWLFAPAWSILYILIGTAGARTWARGPHSTPMRTWFLQMALNFAWTPAFFVFERPDIALGIILALLLMIFAFIAMAWRRDRLSALLFTPYAAWVAFASLLNFEIWRLN